jgi:hypothetical protein
MPRTFTLDTNCLIAVANNEPAAGAVRALADAHTAGRADVAVVAMSASEKQRGGYYLRNFAEFRDRLVSLGLGHLNVILPMGYWGISFWGHCLWPDDATKKLEHEIHSIVRRQSFWDKERLKLRESLAPLVCNVMRLADGAAKRRLARSPRRPSPSR